LVKTNAPAILQSFVNDIFSKNIGENTAKSNLDDRVVHSKTLKEYVQHIRTILFKKTDQA